MSEVTITTAAGARPSVAYATNIDTLLLATDKEKKITAPPENVQNKTAFIFNNLNQLNLQTKCEDLKKTVTEEHYPWLSQYLVMQRVSVELNFHNLYSNFLDALNAPEVNEMVTRETYRNIRVLLGSDKSIANFSDRSLLKNLGHWLGMLRLGRNLPILYGDLNLKSLLIEAYHKGQQELLYVVPFIAKVLESCAKSIFKPRNPWTMAILNILAELHQEPDLKLNLKFEIEVLCKKLNVKVDELKPGTQLKDTNSLKNLKPQLSNPNKTSNVSHPSTIPMSNMALLEQSYAQAGPMPRSSPQPLRMSPTAPPPMARSSPQMLRLSPQFHVSPQRAMSPQVPMSPNFRASPQVPINVQPTFKFLDTIRSANTAKTTFSNGDPYGEVLGLQERFKYLEIDNSAIGPLGEPAINQHILLFQNFPHLKNLVRPAIERSIQEWMHPIVDRAMKYTLSTCEHIVRKDFALEPDEMKIRSCAQNMIKNLCGNMTMLFCRMQLVECISDNLKTAFLSAMIPVTPQQKEVVESTTDLLAMQNIDLATAVIQKTVLEKALNELEKRLMVDFEIRKMTRQNGLNYYDHEVLTYQTERIPEKLRLRIGGITASQMALYEELGAGMQQQSSAGARKEVRERRSMAETADLLLREWLALLHNPAVAPRLDDNFALYLQLMRMHGILNDNDNFIEFLGAATQIVVEHVYELLAEERLKGGHVPRARYYEMCDHLVRLLVLFAKSISVPDPTAKISVINQILSVIGEYMIQDHEKRGTEFHQLPFQRLFMMLFLDLTKPDPAFDIVSREVLSLFTQTLHMVRPAVVPGFAFAWLDIIGHRTFITRMLSHMPHYNKGWEMYSVLIFDMIRYMVPFLNNPRLAPSVAALYRGVLRLMLVLLHDFPEIFCDHSYELCDLLPQNCVQMRNLVLSAYPRGLRLPDPFMPELKLEHVVESRHMPRGLVDTAPQLAEAKLLAPLDTYLQRRAPVTFLADLRSYLQVAVEGGGQTYKIRLMNAVVAYVGGRGVAQLMGAQLSATIANVAHNAHMDVFQSLAVDLDYEGRYIFLNAISTHLRYPNAHTSYFICCLLHLFASANSMALKEQITRMLLERVIANRPHPWGLLVTFTELLKNPVYEFWDLEFLHCADEIERLVVKVAYSCGITRIKTSRQGKPEQNGPLSVC